MNAIASPTAAPLPTVYLVAVDEAASAVMVLDMACGLGGALAGAAELHIVHVVAAPVGAVNLVMAPAVPQALEATGRAILDRAGGARELALPREDRAPPRGRHALACDHAARCRMCPPISSSSERPLARGSRVCSSAPSPNRSSATPAARCSSSARRSTSGCRGRDRAAVRRLRRRPGRSHRATLWCERHSTHHPHGNLHYELPPTFAVGSMNYVP